MHLACSIFFLHFNLYSAEQPNAQVEAGTLVRMLIPAALLGTGRLASVSTLLSLFSPFASDLLVHFFMQVYSGNAITHFPAPLIAVKFDPVSRIMNPPL